VHETAPVGRERHAKLLRPEIAAKKLPDLEVVIDDKNVRVVLHPLPSSFEVYLKPDPALLQRSIGEPALQEGASATLSNKAINPATFGKLADLIRRPDEDSLGT
jgi:hypothetical protein